MGIIDGLLRIRKNMKHVRDCMSEEEYKQFKRNLPKDVFNSLLEDHQTAVVNERCYACKWYKPVVVERGYCQLDSGEIEDAYETTCKYWARDFDII